MTNITVGIKNEPHSVKVGENVVLIPGGSRRNLFSCRWFRGDKYRYFEIMEFLPFNSTVTFKDGYTGRESIDSDCKLHVRNLSLWDSNFYRVEKISFNNTMYVGVTALLVLDKLGFEPRTGLSPVATIGVIVACFVGLSFFVGLVVFQTASTVDRVTTPYRLSLHEGHQAQPKTATPYRPSINEGHKSQPK
ncbi:carcinoembryonic antigen-related cell adhesion molecule 3-like [Anolis sagrei]|uniref:carcinoembryonic antigen-related cell adhesion molecule 3-like n=1 Tax=Anolis sagrei TaxID=38937 RepID=UPI0035218CDA